MQSDYWLFGYLVDKFSAPVQLCKEILKGPVPTTPSKITTVIGSLKVVPSHKRLKLFCDMNSSQSKIMSNTPGSAWN